METKSEKTLKTIAHVAWAFVEKTENWFYFQITNAQSFNHVVLSQKRINHDEFPFDSANVITLESIGAFRNFAIKSIRRLFGSVLVRRFSEFTQSKNVNLIHGHFGTAAYSYALPLASKHNIPLVVTFYGIDISHFPKQEKWRKRYQELFNKGSLFLAEGEYMQKTMIQLGCPSEKTQVQRIGIDVSKFPYKARSKIIDQPTKFLFIGRFTEKKGLPILLEAFLITSKHNPDVKLTIIGDASKSNPSELAIKEHLMAVVNKNKLEGKVNFKGFIPYEDLENEYYKHDILLAPSIVASSGDTEGGAPVSITEACSTGMPVIASRHCDIPGIVHHGKNGFLAAEGNAQEFAQRMIEVAGNPDQWGDMGQYGTDLVNTKFNLEKQVKRLEELYQQTIVNYQEQ